MKFNRMFPLLLLLLITFLALQGCSLMPRQQMSPDDAREQAAAREEAKTLPGIQLAQGYTLLAQVRALAADGLKTGLINKAEGQRFLEMTNAARTALDTARDMYLGGDPNAVNKGLAIAHALIQDARSELEAKIKERGKKGAK